MLYPFTTHYATSFNVSFNIGSSSQSLYYTTMIVNLVNERLRDPFVPLSNETIAEVAIMAAFEVKPLSHIQVRRAD
ncbi:uncharacterized protein RCO7_14968 [Rhynchosporium graminicola]|uniref:Uncharacterized protein n=1 Tax=Rhynchosporium graminicola TaxID=2792576 RepID=A0A1E1LCI5_9HELO|nr:uncharacterized protein RCO7_14968 [Rhynchosporium commune]